MNISLKLKAGFFNLPFTLLVYSIQEGFSLFIYHVLRGILCFTLSVNSIKTLSVTKSEFTKAVTCKVTDDIYKGLKSIAEEKGESVNKYLRGIIQGHLSNSDDSDDLEVVNSTESEHDFSEIKGEIEKFREFRLFIMDQLGIEEVSDEMNGNPDYEQNQDQDSLDTDSDSNPEEKNPYSIWDM
jgi:hypothetical protein